MNKLWSTTVVSLVFVTCLASSVAQAQRPARFDKRWLASHSVVSRYLRIRNGRLAGWKDRAFHRRVYRCRVNYLECENAWKAFTGDSPADLKRFARDSLVIAQDGRRRWGFVMTSILRYSGEAAPFSAVVHKIPGAARLIANTIDQPVKVASLYKKRGDAPYWALFYLGAQKELPSILRGISAKGSTRAHSVAALSFLYAWKLSGSQRGTLERFCLNKAFQDSYYRDATGACLRYLGRTRTKNREARRFIGQLAKNATSVFKVEAIRAASHMRLTSLRSQLLDNVKRAHRKSNRRVRRGRRYVTKSVDSWGTNWMAVPSAVALLGMGDRYAAKAVKSWLAVAKDGTIHDPGAFNDLFNELVFAGPKTQKKLRRQLTKAYRQLRRKVGSDVNRRRTVYRAALSLLQQGDSVGLPQVIATLKRGDPGEVREVLTALGGHPGQSYVVRGKAVGLGFLPVGRGGVKPRVAQRLRKTIRNQFVVWSDRTLKAMAIRAYLDLGARIRLAS